MSLSEKIAPEVPYLRRFARALSGSQKSGDSYVRSTLEALVADPSMFPKDVTPRIGLYRVFLKLWNSVGTNEFPDFDFDEIELVHSLQTITPRPRQAFILLSIEGFEAEEIAEIIETDIDTVADLIAEADREIALQIPPARIMIIEDEPIIAEHLQGLVEGLRHGVTGVAKTHKQAVELAGHERPDLILSDIQLEDGSSGVDAVTEILGKIHAPVVFITAHPEMLLTGEGVEPAFLIPKPFGSETVKAVISQALFFNAKPVATDLES
jgi:DNA-directed RNA polymerase specialized sigma24 family protein